MNGTSWDTHSPFTLKMWVWGGDSIGASLRHSNRQVFPSHPLLILTPQSDICVLNTYKFTWDTLGVLPKISQASHLDLSHLLRSKAPRGMIKAASYIHAFFHDAGLTTYTPVAEHYALGPGYRREEILQWSYSRAMHTVMRYVGVGEK